MMGLVESVAASSLALFFSLTSPTHMSPKSCHEFQNLKSCYYPGSPKAKSVIYFFHGFGNNAEAWGWNSVTTKIEKIWLENKAERPHIVSLSFGKSWWYKESEQGKSLKTFIEKFEADEKIKLPRVLYGDSMGAHNALRFAHDEPKLFHKMALICPALPVSFVEGKTPSGIWPFNSFADSVISQLKGVNPLKDSEYLEHYNQIPKIHIAVSTSDHFGFYHGGKALFEKLKRDGVTFEEQDVVHCNVEAKKLAPFMLTE